MESVAVMVLVFVLITAVVAALIAFVVLPSMSGAREAGDDLKELTIADYVDDINAVNKAGYDYDMHQDKRLDEIEDHVGIDDTDVADEQQQQQGNGLLDRAGSVFSGIMDNLEISTPSEEGALATVSLGPFSAPTDLSEVCFNNSCYKIGSWGSTPPANAGDSSGAAPDDTGDVEGGDAGGDQEISGFMAWPSTSGMFKY
eukprot:jgi/Tetstr1/464200/TSEL_009005.t1